MSVSGYIEEDEIIGKAYDARLVRRLATYMQPYRAASSSHCCSC
jgi:hypothetical protein